MGFDPVTTKLSQKDFEVFQAEALKWIEVFGLKDWEILFSFNDENPDCRATCTTTDLIARICSLGLTLTWRHKPTPQELKMCAFHEVLELLLMPLRLRLQDIPEVSTTLLDKEVHRIIRILENSIFALSGPERPKVKRKAKKSRVARADV